MSHAIRVLRKVDVKPDEGGREANRDLPVVFVPELTGIVAQVHQRLAEHQCRERQRVERGHTQSTEAVLPRYSFD